MYNDRPAEEQAFTSLFSDMTAEFPFGNLSVWLTHKLWIWMQLRIQQLLPCSAEWTGVSAFIVYLVMLLYLHILKQSNTHIFIQAWKKFGYS